MPRNGRLVRIALALVAAALLGALAVASATASGARQSGSALSGAGSSLVAPAVQGAWAPAYQSAKGVTVSYNPVGSGTGIKYISGRTVDFGASDAPMSRAQNQGCNGCVQIPWALTSTDPVFNLGSIGSGKLHLTGGVLARIYLGQITRWSDPAIKSLNKGLHLPNEKITVVHRSDGSGDTYVFTNYLSKVSKAWKRQVNFGTSVNWPVGEGGAKNPGVAALVKSTPGAIGYISDFYALQNKIPVARVKNRAGTYPFPRISTIEAAAQLVRSEKIPGNNAISITDPPKSKKYVNAWPLSTFTYVIVPLKTAKAAELKAFISWALQSKQQTSIQRYVFAPMPQVVIKAAKKTLRKVSS
jgi:phosphate transport system substrate-binding protein